MVKQPRAGRIGGKIRRSCLGHGVEIDQPVLDGERYIIRAVPAGDRDHLAGLPCPETGAVGGGRGAARALDQLITVAAAERGDLRADVGDLEYCRQECGTAYKGARLSPPLDQIGLRQFRQRLAHRHARAAIARHQFVLERDTVARGPFTGQNPPLDVESDLLVQRRLVGRRKFLAVRGEAHATSLRTAALNASRACCRRR